MEPSSLIDEHDENKKEEEKKSEGDKSNDSFHSAKGDPDSKSGKSSESGESEQEEKEEQIVEPLDEYPKACKHYKRRCFKRCPTCKEFFPCRLCHDKVHFEEEMDPKKNH